MQAKEIYLEISSRKKVYGRGGNLYIPLELSAY